MTRDLLDKRDKELINLKVNMGESLTKFKELKIKLDEQINRQNEMKKEKMKLEEDLEKTKKKKDKIKT